MYTSFPRQTAFYGEEFINNPYHVVIIPYWKGFYFVNANISNFETLFLFSFCDVTPYNTRRFFLEWFQLIELY